MTLKNTDSQEHDDKQAKPCNAIISIDSLQTHIEDNTAETFNVITEGDYLKKGEKYYITYKETDLTGMEGSNSIIKIDPIQNIITISRIGEYASKLIYELNKRYTSLYHLPFGTLTMEVETHSISISCSQYHASIMLVYTLDMGSDITKNEIKITANTKK